MNDQPPQENVEIFIMLYGIETALRELIIEVLNEVEGVLWYNKCLPGDVLDKYQKGRLAEKRISWSQCIPHHPIYYIDFPDLKKIIERESNWKSVFESIFSRKDILASTLSELEPLRNKVAHNRKASTKDVEIARGAYSKLSTAIGTDYFGRLSKRCTLGLDIPDQLILLKEEAEKSLHICLEYGRLEELKRWELVRTAWWFDETYLCEKLDKIITFFQVLNDYSLLPRLRGSGHKIEAWVKDSNIEIQYLDAKTQFDAVLTIRGI